jgi:hypothetical protein
MAKKKLSPIEQFVSNHPEWKRFADLIALPPTAAEIAEEFPDADPEVLRRCFETHSIGTANATRGAVYVRGRREGETDRWVAMVALQVGPVLKTEATYFAGHKTMGHLLSDKEIAIYRKLSKDKFNFIPGPGYIYNSNIASTPGDPDGWMPPTDARTHVRKVAEKRGVALIREDGAEIVKARAPDVDPYESAPAMAPDLVRANVRRMVKKDPSLRKKRPQELREMAMAKHGPVS